MSRIAAQKGISGLYRGFLSPFLAQTVYKSVIFSTNSLARKLIVQEQERKDTFLYGIKLFSCGFIAGGVNSFVVTPVEFVRNNLIVLPKSEAISPVDLLKQTLKRNEKVSQFISKIYTGYHVTLIRDGIGMGSYFLGFHLLFNFLQTKAGKDSRFINTLTSGATAGLIFWSVALPFDYMKTKIQIAAFQGNRVPTMREIAASTNVLTMYRGWQVALGRGIPGAAATLTVYSYAREMLD